MTNKNGLMVHRYSSRVEAFYVNSWIIEFDRGLVIVDSQFLLSEAKGLVKKIQEIAKPPIALLITHPHPDHYNGGAFIKSVFPQIEIISTQKTLDGIKSSEGPKRDFWTPIFHEDYPPVTAFPSKVALSNKVISILNEDFIFEDIGAGECENVSTIFLPGHNVLLSSDLIYNEVHPWLAEGRSLLWLEQITHALNKYSNIKHVYPGHGAATDINGFHRILNYINRFQQLLHIKDEFKEVATALKTEFPGYPLEMLIDYNIPAVAKELGLQLNK
jgi:glyoxylase-like metal-dependent hydrolase (beta-lactamase superfamily II)